MCVDLQGAVIVVGVPQSLRPVIESRFRGRVLIRLIPLGQDGGFRLGPKPHATVALLETYSDEALNLTGSYNRLSVILLPYTSRPLPDEVLRMALILEEVGANILRPQSGILPWPSRSPRMDTEFLSDLGAAICQSIEHAFPSPAVSDEDTEIACELLRGLVSHNKMGRNNHSHEDDMWKARGKELGPGDRDKIVQWLLRVEILARKKNNSAGGTGWVYWIGNVANARALCPNLEPYFK